MTTTTKRSFFLPLVGRVGSQRKTKKKFDELFGQLDLKTNYPWMKDSRLKFKVVYYFKEKANGDIDNLLKSLFDSFQNHGVILNDSQIKHVDAKIEESSLFEGISVEVIKIYP